MRPRPFRALLPTVGSCTSTGACPRPLLPPPSPVTQPGTAGARSRALRPKPLAQALKPPARPRSTRLPRDPPPHGAGTSAGARPRAPRTPPCPAAGSGTDVAPRPPRAFAGEPKAGAGTGARGCGVAGGAQLRHHWPEPGGEDEGHTQLRVERAVEGQLQTRLPSAFPAASARRGASQLLGAGQRSAGSSQRGGAAPVHQLPCRPRWPWVPSLAKCQGHIHLRELHLMRRREGARLHPLPRGQKAGVRRRSRPPRAGKNRPQGGHAPGGLDAYPAEQGPSTSRGAQVASGRPCRCSSPGLAILGGAGPRPRDVSPGTDS